jgi:predicted nucleotidyltransferase
VLDRDGIIVWHEREAIKRMVLEAFSDYDADVFLFGSRATRKARERSDYDVGYRADHDLRPSRLAQLEEELEDLPIPSHVDLVDFQVVPDEFSRMVFKKRQVEIWKKRYRNSIFELHTGISCCNVASLSPSFLVMNYNIP